MADRNAVANKRALAELRLRRVAERLGASSGEAFEPPTTPAHRYPDLYAAELLERVSDFMERLEAQERIR